MGARSYWVFALAVMLGMAWVLAAEFGWVGSRAKAHVGGTYGSAYLKRGQSLDIDGGQPDLSWGTVRQGRGHVPFVVAARGAGLVLAGKAPWEKIDRDYLARLTYSSARLYGGRVGTVLALHTAQGNYAKLRKVRKSDDGGAMWEWVLYPRPEVHK